MRRISSLRPYSSEREDGDVMLKTNRKPWPFFMYTSLMDARQCQRGRRVGDGRVHGLLNCSVPAVSRLKEKVRQERLNRDILS